MNNGRVVIAAWTALAMMIFASVTALTQETETVRGAELIAPMKTGLKKALLAGMQEGPLNAIRVCKDQAPAIVDSLATEGVEIGRTSHRLRNPVNSAPAWVDPILKEYLGEGSDRAAKLVHLPTDRLGYVEPIVTQALCLACHGQDLAPEVVAQINRAYPDDKATGFEIGDLRGVYWVEYPEAD